MNEKLIWWIGFFCSSLAAGMFYLSRFGFLSEDFIFSLFVILAMVVCSGKILEEKEVKK